MSLLPTLKEELDRKSFETIDWLATAYDHGKLTNAQYAAGLEALFMAVSGLCDQEIFELISVASGIAGVSVSLEKRHFIKDEFAISLTWAGGQEEFHTLVRKEGIAMNSRTRCYDTAKEARAAFAEMAEKILAMGYVEL